MRGRGHVWCIQVAGRGELRLFAKVGAIPKSLKTAVAVLSIKINNQFSLICFRCSIQGERAIDHIAHKLIQSIEQYNKGNIFHMAALEYTANEMVMFKTILLTGHTCHNKNSYSHLHKTSINTYNMQCVRILMKALIKANCVMVYLSNGRSMPTV